MNLNCRIENFKVLTNAARKMARKYGNAGLNDTDDIAQNALLRVLKRHGNSTLPTIGWLAGAVRFAALDARRANYREEKYVTRGPLENAPDSNGDWLYTFSRLESCAAKVQEPSLEFDELQQVQMVLGKLSEPLRKTVYLVAEGYTYEEVAKRTGTNIGTVRSRMHYARKYAKKLFVDLS